MQVARAVGDLVVGFLDERPEQGGVPFYYGPIAWETLTLHVGDRVLLFAPLVHSLIAFGVVLAVTLLAVRVSRERR